MKVSDSHSWILAACRGFPRSLFLTFDARSRDFVEGALDDETHGEFAPLTPLFATPQYAAACSEYRVARLILEIDNFMEEAMRTGKTLRDSGQEEASHGA
ncbi:MAG: hypothetical protein KatS3mg015_3169 [Fimbriimonadales bacterium]|nr:MAG: hypothetical protein KatS3mg015_3169 [Fimbriimonadales bacterium]